MICKPVSLLAALLGASALAAAAAAAPASASANHPVVNAPAGPVEGLTIGEMDAFRGIPYAAPPVGPCGGSRRRPAIPWQGTLNATRFGHHCPQTGGSVGTSSTNEDCLFLNVFAPPEPSPRPRSR